VFSGGTVWVDPDGVGAVGSTSPIWVVARFGLFTRLKISSAAENSSLTAGECFRRRHSEQIAQLFRRFVVVADHPVLETESTAVSEGCRRTLSVGRRKMDGQIFLRTRSPADDCRTWSIDSDSETYQRCRNHLQSTYIMRRAGSASEDSQDLDERHSHHASNRIHNIF
jgi:hypothetical protein